MGDNHDRTVAAEARLRIAVDMHKVDGVPLDE